jgi:linoleate 10R-lipoxygenase
LHEKDGTVIPPPSYDSLSEAELRDLRDDGKAVDYLQLNIPGFQRDPDTKLYNDDQLAGVLQAATRVPAAAFKVDISSFSSCHPLLFDFSIQARGVPGVMRVVEILGIEQARNWGCCTVNDFRRFLGLKPYSSFEQWNPDKSVADAARKLYRNIENLELYVGLIAEESKPVGDGAGLCPSCTLITSPCIRFFLILGVSDTMSRAILADAVALVRGDRYLTYDCTPFNLTAWGFTDASRNTENAAWGGQLGRVLARALPNNYDGESVYTHFPLITPTGQPHSMDKTLTRINLIDKYSLAPPVKKLATHIVVEPKAIYAAFAEESDVKLITTYAQNIKDIKLSPSFLSVIDDPAAYARVTKLVQDVFVPKDSLKQLGQYFYDKTIELLREKSFSLVDRSTHSVDLVKDVTRLIPVHWVSAQIVSTLIMSY